MTLRVDVRTLGQEIRDSLDRGESVEIERDGEVVACIPALGSNERTGTPGETPMAKFIRLRRQQEPLDEEFERDLELARQLLNEPVVTEAWD
jgi:antitoxin (DNA-binding transcriptional repressor) of toxin-antitoxin stability system